VCFYLVFGSNVFHIQNQKEII